MNKETINSIYIETAKAVEEIKKSYSWFVEPSVGFINKATNTIAYYSPRTKEITFNLAWMNVNLDTLENIVIHELTHSFLHQLANRFCRKPYPSHGKDFRMYMAMFGGTDTRAAIPLNKPESIIEKKQNKTTYKYTCGCKIFSLTSIRHSRILKGTVYSCPSCKNPLKPV